MTDFYVLREELDANARHFDEIYPSPNESLQCQYYDQAIFTSALPNNSESDLSIFDVNNQSINAKGDKFISY